MSRLVYRANEALGVRPKESMDDIVRHISMGGSLTSYCETMGYSLSTVKGFIFADRGRREAYEAARKEQAFAVRDKIIDQLIDITDADLTSIVRNGEVLPPSEWPESVRRACQQMNIGRTKDGDITLNIKLPDKLKATELLGKAFAVWTEKIQVDGKIDLAAVISAGRDRAKKRLKGPDDGHE